MRRHVNKNSRTSGEYTPTRRCALGRTVRHNVERKTPQETIWLTKAPASVSAAAQAGVKSGTSAGLVTGGGLLGAAKGYTPGIGGSEDGNGVAVAPGVDRRVPGVVGRVFGVPGVDGRVPGVVGRVFGVPGVVDGVPCVVEVASVAGISGVVGVAGVVGVPDDVRVPGVVDRVLWLVVVGSAKVQSTIRRKMSKDNRKDNRMMLAVGAANRKNWGRPF